MRGGSSAGSDSPPSPTLCDFKEGNFRSGSHGHFLRAEFASVCSRGLQQGRDSGSCRGSKRLHKSSTLGTSPEKAMAPHSSTLAWKIPWMEEPGRLQSMGLLRVGHD